MKLTANDTEILSLMKITTANGDPVDWKYNCFPDGQIQIKIPKSAIQSMDTLNVKVSITNPVILDLFMQLISEYPLRSLYVNYLYGARCDKYEAGEYWVCNVAQKTINDIFEYVENTVFLAPHCSDLLNENEINYKLPDCVSLSDYDLVIFPDESAYQRYADQIDGYECAICEKRRDQETGNIISHNIPNLPDHVNKVILLDDLADAGGSFMSIANTLPDNVKADLFVFHGVFTNNALSRLLEKFNNVIVSNSLPEPQNQYNNLEDEDKNRVKIFDVWDGS